MRKTAIIIFVLFVIVTSLFFLKQEKNELEPVIQYIGQEIPQTSPVVFGFLHRDLSQSLLKRNFSNCYTYDDLKKINYSKGMYLVTIIFDRNSPYSDGILRNSTREWNVFISRNIQKLELRGQKYFQKLGVKAEIYKFS